MFKVIIVSIIVLWLLNKVYKAVFPFLQMSSAASDQMRQMQEQMKQMKEMERRMQENQARQRQAKRSKIDGDYIEYEELK